MWCNGAVSAIDRGFEPRSGQAKDYNIGCFIFLFFYSNMIFLFKMLVTFLLQKPKLLMKYFILIFSYLIQYCFYQTVVVVFVYIYIYIVCLMSVYVCMYRYCYTQKCFICNKDYLIKLISNNIMQLIRIRL